MLRSLLIFSNGGHFIFSKNIDREDADDNNPNLISSLLSAINMFANSIKAGDIDSIEMKNYTLVGKKSSDYSIRFVSIIDKGDKVQECRNFLNTCEKSFINRFASELKEFETGALINTDKFKAWEEEFDQITSEIDFSPIQSVMEDIIKEISSQFTSNKVSLKSSNNQIENIKNEIIKINKNDLIEEEQLPEEKPLIKIEKVKKKSKKKQSKISKKVIKKKKNKIKKRLSDKIKRTKGKKISKKKN
ncbi:MAG: hypothetical protein EAX96_05190 [Candidatus Lokiarchaeota archaeon]|nr:hypothetical protein [Candidatus Lokiarchaeota archaeon]